jgi:zinc/manganese transport system permease protein
LAGAAVFALSRTRRQTVPQEAIIGVVYAVAACAAILVHSRAPGGGEELRELMVGPRRFIDWSAILKITLLYGTIGWIHWVFRGPLLAISRNPAQAYLQGMRVRVWDFLFYATFALVVTSSVEMAGVLLVFSFLVVPALCGILLGQTVAQRLFFGWTAGFLTSVAGITASYWFDLPTGATVVCAFGVCLALCALWRAAVRRA